MTKEAIQLYCSTWVGYTTDAEHYYCKLAVFDEEKLSKAVAENDYCVPVGEPFRYVPTEEAARAIAEKDNYRGGEEHIRNEMRSYMESGTTRFFSLHHICSEAHKQYPDARLYGFFPSHRAFCERYIEESTKGIYDEQDYVVL